MVENKDFPSVEFFRKIRDEHATLLHGKRQEEIIAFFQIKQAPNNRLKVTTNRIPSSIA